MPLPRKHLIDESRSGCYHLISRCVRRAFLCGDRAEHRRAWVKERIQAAAAAFAVDVLAYAIMGNHLHLVVRTRRDDGAAASWTAAEVAARWAHAHPRLDREGVPVAWDPAVIQARSRNAAWVATARGRLHSLSWFMKSIKEQLARRANRADGCTGHFWEGRFQSIPLLDERAILACMAYVDLNPIRATIADRPETSDFTSVQERIHLRQTARARAHLAANSLPASPAPTLTRLERERQQAAEEADSWLAPVASLVVGMEQTPLLTRDDYLTLVDETGRVVRSGKRGAIPPHLAPILARLDLDLAGWIDLMQRGGAFRGTAFGSLASRAGEAIRRGARWIVDRTRGLYRNPMPDTPSTT